MSIFSQLAVKPWERMDQVYPGAANSGGILSIPKHKFGLGIFLAVVTSLFLILLNAYLVRRGLEDWRPLPELTLLWFNTGLLILSSISLQWARVSVRHGQGDGMLIGLLAGGGCACTFLAGQLWAWQQMEALGYFANTNPANTFFYLITAVHGLHLLGGLVALGKTTFKVLRGFEKTEVSLSVEMCAIYWHFLLVIWLIFFGLMFFT